MFKIDIFSLKGAFKFNFIKYRSTSVSVYIQSFRKQKCVSQYLFDIFGRWETIFSYKCQIIKHDSTHMNKEFILNLNLKTSTNLRKFGFCKIHDIPLLQNILV